MKTEINIRPSIGITLRIALLSWLVTITTLLIFVIVIIPQQKQIYQENLESKARGIVASLRDVVAGAAINDDLPSVVAQCNDLLKEDKTMEYLVLTKNDGNSLVHHRSGWSAETNAGKEWRPAERKPVSGIGLVSIVKHPVFRYSQPFDYSGIEWGWIHVGLSLESYERNVALIYRRTGMLAIACILLSLGASMVYARRMVHPILDLRKVVQQVTGGDLSARAVINRSDELGSLAQSFNTMTDTLRQRDRILESVRLAAQQFLSGADWRLVINGILLKIGQTAGASRAYVFENHTGPGGELVASLRYEYAAPDQTPFINTPMLQNLPWCGTGLEPWDEQLKRGEIFAGLVRDFSPAIQAKLAPQKVQSLILVPIMVEDAWWGYLGLDECNWERTWTDAERDSLHAAADMLGAAIERQRVQDALIESKATLEQRVLERTRELQEQVQAKERARTELAETQSRLLEISRRAGMAEVSIGVLHNVGNVLNSVNVSTTLVVEYLRKSRTADFVKLSDLLKLHENNLGDFFTNNPKGSLVPGYVQNLARVLTQEQDALSKEMETLRKHVDHIREIVAMQQCYAKVSGVVETVLISELLEDAVRLNGGSLERHHIRLLRDYSTVEPIAVDKHKVIQILINLIRNAKLALNEKGGPDKELKLRIVSLKREENDPRVQIQVIDNGIGIPSDNLVRIFSHGFTTRKDGHGFGLHSGALAAQELGGSLSCHSDGIGKGATFTLELPFNFRKAT